MASTPTMIEAQMMIVGDQRHLPGRHQQRGPGRSGTASQVKPDIGAERQKEDAGDDGMAAAYCGVYPTANMPPESTEKGTARKAEVIASSRMRPAADLPAMRQRPKRRA